MKNFFLSLIIVIGASLCTVSTAAEKANSQQHQNTKILRMIIDKTGGFYFEGKKVEIKVELVNFLKSYAKSKVMPTLVIAPDEETDNDYLIIAEVAARFAGFKQVELEYAGNLLPLPFATFDWSTQGMAVHHIFVDTDDSIYLNGTMIQDKDDLSRAVTVFAKEFKQGTSITRLNPARHSKFSNVVQLLIMLNDAGLTKYWLPDETVAMSLSVH